MGKRLGLGLGFGLGEPSTRQPILTSPSRSRFELARSCRILRWPRSPAVACVPMITSKAESACAAAGGDMAGAYRKPAEWRRSVSTTVFEAAT